MRLLGGIYIADIVRNDCRRRTTARFSHTICYSSFEIDGKHYKMYRLHNDKRFLVIVADRIYAYGLPHTSYDNPGHLHGVTPITNPIDDEGMVIWLLHNEFIGGGDVGYIHKWRLLPDERMLHYMLAKGYLK